MVAHLTLVRVVFVFRRSAMIFAPSTRSPLKPKLRRRVELGRQRLLTLEACAMKGGTHLSLQRELLLLSISQSAMRPLISPR